VLVTKSVAAPAGDATRTLTSTHNADAIRGLSGASSGGALQGDDEHIGGGAP
jgi:hypothetical protein